MRSIGPLSRLLIILFLASVILFMFTTPRPVQAQQPNARWRHFTTDHGLAANEVWAVFQDQEGALWFGTNGGGVSRFDGRWHTFNQENTAGGLPSNLVRTILQSADGVLWFGTPRGLSRYDGREWRVFGEEEGLLDGHVRAILETEDGTLLLGTGGGVIAFDRRLGRFDVVDTLAGVNVSSLLVDRQGVLWVGNDNGLIRCTGPDWQVCVAIESLAGVQVHQLLETQEGHLWVATVEGLRRFDGRSWGKLGTEQGLPVPEVWSLAQDDRGILWFGTNGGGVCRYDGHKLIILTTAIGLTADNVTSIIQDRDGALWFGTVGGVSRYDERTWQTPLEEPIRALDEAADGSLWVGTAENGLRYYDGQEWHSLISEQEGIEEGLPSNRISALYWDARKTLWVGTDGWGLGHFDGQRWEVFTRAKDGLAADSISAIVQTRDGTLWVGTPKGLSRFDGQRWETLTAANTHLGLVDDWIWTLVEDRDGILWVGTKGGVSRYDGQRWLEPFTRANSGLGADEVRAILQSRDGALWFGTWAGGASRYSEGEWTTYTVADGLAANGIYALAEDSNGGLWFGTLSGATRYDGRTWRSYTTADGLASNVVRAVYVDGGGVIWLGTESGLSRYQPDPGVPSGHILTINGQPYEGGGVVMLKGETLAINFGGGDLRTPTERLASLCYLEGRERSWHPCRDWLISYEHLSPGEYTFHLQVRDEDFNYSPPLALPITVKPAVNLPWVGRELVVPVPAFAAMVGVTVTAVGALTLYSVSRRQMRRRAREALRRKFNPYISGEPIRREDMFFGRDALMRHIMHILHNNSIMIHGERRIGKTTLLYQLANRLREDKDPEYRFIPVMVDLEGTPQEAFFYTLMEGIVETCRPLLPQLPEMIFDTASEQEYSDRDFGRDFSRLLAALQESTDKEIRIILLIDEMDVINTYDRTIQLQLRRIFMKELAHNLGAVVAGVKISKEWDRPESPWYNLFNEIELPPFSEEEARELITEPVKGVYRYDEDAIRQIIAYSKGRPHRIQQYCLESVNRMLAARRTRVKLADVEAAHKAVVQSWGEVPPTASISDAGPVETRSDN